MLVDVPPPGHHLRQDRLGRLGAGAETVGDVESVTFITADFTDTRLTLVFDTVLTSPTWNAVAFNGPVVEDHWTGDMRVGFTLSQDFRSELWPLPCNYRYVHRFEFYEDGRFRVGGEPSEFLLVEPGEECDFLFRRRPAEAAQRGTGNASGQTGTAGTY